MIHPHYFGWSFQAWTSCHKPWSTPVFHGGAQGGCELHSQLRRRHQHLGPLAATVHACGANLGTQRLDSVVTGWGPKSLVSIVTFERWGYGFSLIFLASWWSLNGLGSVQTWRSTYLDCFFFSETWILDQKQELSPRCSMYAIFTYITGHFL